MKKNYDKMYNKVFSEYFTKMRLQNKLSRQSVADKIGIKNPTYTCYERGTRDCPLSVFKNLCSFYNVDFIETIKKLDDEVTRRLLNE